MHEGKKKLLLVNFGIMQADHPPPHNQTNRERLWILANSWPFADVVDRFEDDNGGEACRGEGHGLSRCGVDRYYRELSKYNYVLAPGGARLRDEWPSFLGRSASTHRVWEALYNGVIPIVRSSALDEVFEGLPVLIVDEWKDVTEELLLAELGRFRTCAGGGSFDWDKLFMPHWIEKLNQFRLQASKGATLPSGNFGSIETADAFERTGSYSGTAGQQASHGGQY
jgi:hypothetical protein